MGIPYVLEETTAGICISTERKVGICVEGQVRGISWRILSVVVGCKKTFDTIPAVGSGRLTGSHVEQKSDTQKVV